MDLSVVIPVCDDIRIKECVESIDEDVEVLVVLNGATEEVRNIVRSLGVSTCELEEANLGASLDQGILESSKDNVLLMDSDCRFSESCIEILYDGLRDHKLSKGRVEYERNTTLGSCIADLRNYITEGENAFKPPLAMRRSIIDDIGYYFDRDIHWIEDSELNNRVRRMKIPICYRSDAVIYHPELTPFVDLRSACRYGIGKRIAVEKGIMEGVGTFFPEFFDIMHDRGKNVALYSVLWNIAYFSGYAAQACFDVYHTRKNIREL